MNKRKFGPWWLLLFFWAELCFMELVVHAATAPQFWQPELVLLMLYPLVPAVLLFALCRLFPPRANRVLGPVCSGLCYIFFASQLVYYSIFHCFYSAYSMGNGGQVMQFWKVTLHAIRKNWLPLSLMLLPPVGHAVLGKRFSAARLRLPYLPAFAALAAAVHFGLMALLPVFGTQPLSAYDLYHSTNDMKQTTAHLGLMPAFRLDVHRLLFGFEGGEIELATETKAPMEAPTEAPTEPPERPEHTVKIQVSVNCDCTITNAEGQTVRQGDDSGPEGDLVVYSIDLYGFDTGTLPMEVWEVAASDSFTLETTTSPCAFCAEIGDAFYAVTECTGVTRIEFRDGYIKLTGSEMTYKMLTTFDAGEDYYFEITGTGTTEIEFPMGEIASTGALSETYQVEKFSIYSV